MEPEFLRIEDVLRIHEDQIERYGGSPGLRDSGLLASVVETPRATFGGKFLHTDLFEMAAAYLYHIVQNHPFVDGNKRTGAACAIIFLALNRIELDADEEGLITLTLAVAQGQAGQQQIAEFFRKIAH